MLEPGALWKTQDRPEKQAFNRRWLRDKNKKCILQSAGYYYLAEEAGFEPACRISPTIRFRVGAVMTTSVPLRESRMIPRPTFLPLLAVLLLGVLAGCSRPLPFPPEDRVLVVLTHRGRLSYEPGPTTTPAPDGVSQELGVDGFQHHLVQAFAISLGMETRFLVVAPDEVPHKLSAFHGHLAATWLGPMNKKDKLLSATPIIETEDVLVQLQGSAHGVREPKMLEGKSVRVMSGSHAAANLRTLKDEYPHLQVQQVRDMDGILLLEKVAKQEIDLAIVDRDTYSIGLNYFPTLESPFKVGQPYPIAWQFPHGTSPALLEQANQFITQSQENGLIQRLKDRYFGHLDRLRTLDNTVFIEKIGTLLPSLKPWFIEAEEETGVDWRLLAAIAYQESGWDPLATSWTNVRGIMMLTEETANRLGVKDRLDSRQSIRAGATYLQVLRKSMPDTTPEPDRTWEALAAYNLGPGNLMLSRQFAKHNQLDPDKWFDMKKALPGFARVSNARGGEAVIMVENIRLLYDTLRRYEVPHVSGLDSSGTRTLPGEKGARHPLPRSLTPPSQGLSEKKGEVGYIMNRRVRSAL